MKKSNESLPEESICFTGQQNSSVRTPSLDIANEFMDQSLLPIENLIPDSENTANQA